MSFTIILLVSLVVFLLYISAISLLSQTICKLLKLKIASENWNIFLSTGILTLYEVSLWQAAFLLPKKFSFMFTDLYLLLICTGITMVIWIYFKWDIVLATKPCLNADKSQVRKKKITIFAVVMAFSFYLGYSQMMHFAINVKIDDAASLANFTLVPCIIAFDRVLSQLHEQWLSTKK